MIEEEEEGYENFEIDDRDLHFALNPGSHKGLSKNQQLYGIWADREESDDDESHLGFGASSFNRKSKNYSAPVNFVSGGIKEGNKIVGASSESVEDDRPIRIEGRRRGNRRQAGANVFAGMRLSATREAADPSKFADWAKYSKSDVIMKMMRKMGYVPGQGLGVSKQGIVEPVEAVLRPGRAAVGAYGSESKGPRYGDARAVVEDDEHRTGSDAEIPRKKNWKKSGAKARPQYQYKTVDEVLSEGSLLKKRLDFSSTGVKVIDMTGKEQKVYSGYDAFVSKTRVEQELEDEHRAFDVPELTYNINMLLDMTEETIRRNDRQIRYLKDQQVTLQHEYDHLKTEFEKEEKEKKKMEEILGIMMAIQSDGKNNTLSVEKCQEIFENLKNVYYEEYRLLKLEDLAVASVLPLIKEYFKEWNPLVADQVDYGYTMMEKWKSLLDAQDRSVLGVAKSLDDITPFERFLWEGWMPNIRRSSLGWNPRDDTFSMLRVVEKWLPLLPIWMRDNLLEQVIIPRIAKQVDEWNPMVDRVPIHTWLHPWLDVMGDRLQPVFSPLRQKLARALREWNPTDQSAISILRPWKTCFAPGTMSAFLAQNITPKLEKALREMDYDPTRNRRYDEFYATIAWIELIGLEGVAAILVKSFFPKWYNTLCTWLDSPGMAIEEVAMWYNEWKSRLPIELSSLHVIREQLMRALMAMNQARQGIQVSRQPLPPPPSNEIRVEKFPPPPPPNVPLPAQFSFKDLVEMRAREAGIVYVPQPNKFREGKPVFWFGSISIYIDRNVIFGYNVDTQQWAPIGLDHLMRIC